ncbi:MULTISPECIES: universal stress protein [unclassified Achromobacter]|uniref:universal stress protein n=1 Tax=unclassified Achromobacter TaxID=2626865 RepID=UPI000B51724A|nr:MULTISPECIES: universal stress protein [unclassified Achromobacter]OWT75654.1 universal stress protein [Achromobacter sp. HZ28]OWT76315.1 universal stress protein [Achromobacter sp. HZ34]
MSAPTEYSASFSASTAASPATASPVASGPILLATDLSARCDRALDRAVVLAKERGVPLIALHVLESVPATASPAAPSWRRLSEDHRELARYRLGLDLDDPELSVEIHVESGDASDRIVELATRHGCSLIVTGIARDESLGKLLLGSTVKKLVRHVSVPVLVVKNRPHGGYREAVVATDFSPESRHALQVAAALFPSTSLLLFHAYDTPFGMRRLAEGLGDDAQRDAQMEMDEFLAATPGLPAGVPARALVQDGEPETLLSDYVFAQRCEMVVAGTRRIKGLMGAMVGSVAERLLEALPCDVMLVRGVDPDSK